MRVTVVTRTGLVIVFKGEYLATRLGDGYGDFNRLYVFSVRPPNSTLAPSTRELGHFAPDIWALWTLTENDGTGANEITDADTIIEEGYENDDDPDDEKIH